MTLAELVPTLEVCRQLKVAGFPQDMAMVWIQDGKNHARPVIIEPSVYAAYKSRILCAAPTAGELEEWLMQKGYSVRMHTAYGPFITFGVAKEVVGTLVQISGYSIQTTGYGGIKPNLPSALAALVLDVAG